MSKFITINDQTAGGRTVNQVMLILEKDIITIRQLIKMRKKEEEQDEQISFRAFRDSGFYITINNKQVRNLDQKIKVRNNMKVNFVEMR